MPQQPTVWKIYTVRCSDNTLYAGYTVNLDRRMKMLNRGKVHDYTCKRLPVELFRSGIVGGEKASRIYTNQKNKTYREEGVQEND
jgi:predicted GIY-YIG superfamily endonuclease